MNIKLLAFISVIASVMMLLLMYLFYSPMLDSPESTTKDRFLFISTLALQLYILGFSLYIAIKKRALIEWASEEEKTTAKR